VKPYADHFSRIASAYSSCRPRYPDELFTFLATLTPNRELAWDCAAGSGQATIQLARRFNRVVATDISGAMLDQAPRHPGVEYRVAPEGASGLPDATADLVTVGQALHWLDPATFYTEVERVLVPGGVLAVWTYGTQQLDDPDLDRVLGSFYTEVVGPYWPPERCHVESGYRTLPFPFSELETPAIAMLEHWNLAQLLGYVRTWSATQRFRETSGHDPVDQLERNLLPYWGNPSMSLRVRWPLALRVGRRPT
jgi:ubiquinone/menaquinone biosynthesis C-methylase UbiE